MDTLIENFVKSPALYSNFEEVRKIISLEQGKRKKFYSEIKEDDKVEFINGEKYFQSPARMQHVEIAGNVYLLLKAFCSKYDLGFVGYEKILISLTRNDYEPDICFFNKEISKDFQPKKMQFPAPNLVVEVLSESTEDRDRGIKYEDYAIHGIVEYWIIDPEKQIVEQYILEDKKYSLKMKSGTGILESEVIRNFKVPVQSIFNKEENLKALQEIIK